MHFNERDSSVVPELAYLGECNVRLAVGRDGDESGASTPWVFDSGYNRLQAVNHLLPLAGSESTSDKICAVIGPIEPRAHEGISGLYREFIRPSIGICHDRSSIGTSSGLS